MIRIDAGTCDRTMAAKKSIPTDAGHSVEVTADAASERIDEPARTSFCGLRWAALHLDVGRLLADRASSWTVDTILRLLWCRVRSRRAT